MISLIQHFEADSMESQPQNPEFRINPENFTCTQLAQVTELLIPQFIFLGSCWVIFILFLSLLFLFFLTCQEIPYGFRSGQTFVRNTI